MRMEVVFPGGAAVEARFKGHTVLTDQPPKGGGEDRGPAPFDLFLASVATCAGYYALRFCQSRELPTEGLGLTLEPLRDDSPGRVATIRMELRLPPGFPEKYRAAVIRAMDQCAVKRHVLEPPKFEIVTV